MALKLEGFIEKEVYYNAEGEEEVGGDIEEKGNGVSKRVIFSTISPFNLN